jgi:hypothetical protein
MVATFEDYPACIVNQMPIEPEQIIYLAENVG